MIKALFFLVFFWHQIAFGNCAETSLRALGVSDDQMEFAREAIGAEREINKDYIKGHKPYPLNRLFQAHAIAFKHRAGISKADFNEISWLSIAEAIAEHRDMTLDQMDLVGRLFRENYYREISVKRPHDVEISPQNARTEVILWIENANPFRVIRNADYADLKNAFEQYWRSSDAIYNRG